MSATLPQKNRIHWIDYAKTWAIYCVVLIHTPPVYEVKSWLCTFLVPFFFFVSGYLFKVDRTPDLRSFMAKNVRQLLVPYLMIGTLTWLLWLCLLRHVGNGADSGVAWYEPMLNLLLGIPEGITHDIPLWNILCIFMARLLYWLIFRPLPDRWHLPVLFLCGVAGGVISLVRPWPLPWCIDIAPMAVMFFGLGSYARRHDLMKCHWWLVLLALGLMTAISVWNPMARVFRAYYGNMALFMFGGLCGIYAMFGICHYVSRLFGARAAVSFISMNTLLVCGFHLTGFAVIKGMMLALGIPVDIIGESLFAQLLFSAVSLAVCIPVIMFVRRYIPSMAGLGGRSAAVPSISTKNADKC